MLFDAALRQSNRVLTLDHPQPAVWAWKLFICRFCRAQTQCHLGSWVCTVCCCTVCTCMLRTIDTPIFVMGFVTYLRVDARQLSLFWLWCAVVFCLVMNAENTRPHSTVWNRPATPPLAISLWLSKLCLTSSVSASSRLIQAQQGPTDPGLCKLHLKLQWSIFVC